MENKDLIEAVRDKIEERDGLQRTTRFLWVRGHNGDIGNVAADRLAVNGALRAQGVDIEAAGTSEAVTDEAENAEIAAAYQAMIQAMGDDDGQ